MTTERIPVKLCRLMKHKSRFDIHRIVKPKTSLDMYNMQINIYTKSYPLHMNVHIHLHIYPRTYPVLNFTDIKMSS